MKLLKERIFGHALHIKLGCLWVNSSSYMMSAGALKTGCAKPLNSHSTWCNGIKSRSASLSWAQSRTLAQDHWSTELPCAHGRPASLLPFEYLLQALGEISVWLHSQPCGPFEKSRPIFSFCKLFSGPKGLIFFWFLSQPKEMHFRKHGPFPSYLQFRTDCG